MMNQKLITLVVMTLSAGVSLASGKTYDELKAIYDSGHALTFADVPASGVLDGTAVDRDSNSASDKVAFTRNENIVRSVELPDNLSNEDAVRQLQICVDEIPPAGIDAQNAALVQWNFMPNVRPILYRGDHNWSGLLQGTVSWRAATSDGKNVWIGRADDLDEGYGIADVTFPKILPVHESGSHYIIGTAPKPAIPSAVAPDCNTLVAPYRFAGKCPSVVSAPAYCIYN